MRKLHTMQIVTGT